MNLNESKGGLPDFKGSISVAAWFNESREGKTYLSIVLGNRATLFPVEKDSIGKEIEVKEVENIFG